jgi:UDP-glucose 6-dehydrogenase
MMEINENRISKTKKNIEGLEEAIFNLEEELKRLLQAEKLYYKLILKNGTDVRESGLVWVIQKLEVRENDMSQYEFPAYLDKKGRQFLIQKCLN